jgi:hypothetical protein
MHWYRMAVTDAIDNKETAEICSDYLFTRGPVSLVSGVSPDRTELSILMRRESVRFSHLPLRDR